MCVNWFKTIFIKSETKTEYIIKYYFIFFCYKKYENKKNI